MRAAYTPIIPLLLAAGLLAGEAPQPPKPVLQPPGSRPPAAAKAGKDAKSGGASAGNQAGKASSGNAGKAAGTAAKTGDSDGEQQERTGPAPAAIDHDTVILVNEQRFQGTVLSSQPDPDWVMINTGTGTLRLQRSTIRRVEYGLTARMGRVKPDDLAGLIDLARWCRANARNSEALQLLTKAVALPTCDLETRGLFAQLVDELDGADKALPLYIAYRNGGGTSSDLLGRLGELEKARNAWEEQMRSMGLDPGASDQAGAPVAAATATAVEEGYEKYKWDADDPKWSSPSKPTLTTLVTPEGPRRVLQVDVEAHPSDPKIDKAAIVLRRPLVLRQGAKMTMLVANRGTDDLRVGIAVKTGGEWTYYESKPQAVAATKSGQEFAQLSFDLGAADFKAKSSDWAYSARISSLDQVRELQILIHNGSKQGSLWIAGIAFEGGE